MILSIINYFKRNQWQLLLIFLLGHTIVSSFYIQQQDLTFDEKPYYNYVVRWMHGDVSRKENIDDSKTPAVFPSVIPRAIIQLFNKNYVANDLGVADMLHGRYVMCIYTLLIAIILFLWIRDLTGKENLFWTIPLLLFLFDPMVLAYSMIILSDMASGFAMLITLFSLWRFYKFKSVKYFYIFCLALSFSFIVKPSTVFLIPCLLLFFILLELYSKKNLFQLINLKRGLILLITIFLFINASYQFKDSFRTIKSYHFKSELFKTIQNNTTSLGFIPIPFPSSYIYSYDLVQRNKEVGGGVEGSSYRGVFLNGETKLKGGFWNYYIEVGLIKIPVVSLLFILTTVFFGLYIFKRKSFWNFHSWYIIPIIFYLLVMSFLNPFQIGIRHLLIIYPLFFIAIAVAISHALRKRRNLQYVFLALVLIFLTDVVYYYPNYIPYTNWFVVKKKNVYLKTNDSNIDYGQSLSKIRDFIKQNSEFKVPTVKPQVGKFIASIEQIQKFGYLHPNSFDWLLKHKPVGHYNYSLLLFDIKENDLNRD